MSALPSSASSSSASSSGASSAGYVERRTSVSEFIPIRGLRYHVRRWGDARQITPERPLLVLMHGWMDVGASYQFIVDALGAWGDERCIVAADWRGFGLTDSPATDSYWFADYLGDLDLLLDALAPNQAVDLVGHSMGGNVVTIYAGVRPQRIRRLVNLEGWGMPASQPEGAPKRYAEWMDELKEPVSLRPYDSVQQVADRLRKTNPLLRPDRAAWLAPHWARQDEAGKWQILGDPAHKRSNPIQYRKEEVMACWARIEAPVMWIEGDQTPVPPWWGSRYSKEEFHERLGVIPRLERHTVGPAGHMLHHDQPEALAAHLKRFLA